MGLSFSDADPKTRRGKLRRVPDYNSRPVRMRLFALVSALILVLIAAERARDPKTWQWFFALDGRPLPEKIDNRLPPKGDSSMEDVLVTSANAAADTSPWSAATPTSDPSARAWSEGIKALWEPLDSGGRTLLYRLLECAVEQKFWPENEREGALALLTELQQRWDEYQRLAEESLQDLDSDEQTRWRQILDTTNRRFQDEVAEPIQMLGEGRVVLPQQRHFLEQFLADLDALNLIRVADDMTFLRPEENQLWHRYFWQLQRMSDLELAAQSAGEIPYAQLYRQPAQYRGKVVTLRGAVRRSYRVPASRNHLGIETYVVYWVQPFESADTPLVVYALDVPPGFPRVKDRDEAGGQVRFDEEVFVHGILFKRGAYAGQRGTYNAPLVLARVPQWRPAAIALGTGAATPRMLWQMGIFALVVAVVIAGVVYWTSFRRKAHPPPHDERAIAAGLRALADDEEILSPHEALRQLEQQTDSLPPPSART